MHTDRTKNTDTKRETKHHNNILTTHNYNKYHTLNDNNHPQLQITHNYNYSNHYNGSDFDSG
jgi:hypothetical protein